MKDKKWFRIQNFALVLVTILAVPFLYQNCGQVDFAEYQSATSDTPGIVVDPNVGIGVEIRNGAGTVVANGGSLCVGGADAAQSHTVIISIATSLSTEAYYCRRTRPSADNEFWSCEEVRSLGGSSSGGFGRIPDTGDTLAALGYNNLSNGTYELEVSAEGQTQDGADWTTLAVPVSFVVQDCASGGTPPNNGGSVATTTTRVAGNPGTPGTPENPLLTTTTRNGGGGPTTTRSISNPFPTCGDTNPLRSGNQRYNCGSWRYNTSANNLTNPNRSRCCIEQQSTTTTRTVISDPCEALTPATCGDISCSQSGNQRFNCGSWRYNTSASRLTNPNRSRCCIQPEGSTTTTRRPPVNPPGVTTTTTRRPPVNPPGVTTTTTRRPPVNPPGVTTTTTRRPPQPGTSTCEGFSCGTSCRNSTTVLSSGQSPSRALCCETKPTCRGFRCGSGYSPKNPLPTLSCNQTASRNRCCNRDNNTGPVMCSGQITVAQCNADGKALIPNKQCAGQTCTANECCGPNCSTEQINCAQAGKIGRGSWPWPRSSGSETVTDVINESTCCFTPRCEQRYNCKRLDTVPPTWDCSPNQDLGSYVRFTCSSGQEFKPQGACDVNRTTGAVECSADNCCGPSTDSTTSTTPTSIVIPPIDDPFNRN